MCQNVLRARRSSVKYPLLAARFVRKNVNVKMSSKRSDIMQSVKIIASPHYANSMKDMCRISDSITHALNEIDVVKKKIHIKMSTYSERQPANVPQQCRLRRATKCAAMKRSTQRNAAGCAE